MKGKPPGPPPGDLPGESPPGGGSPGGGPPGGGPPGGGPPEGGPPGGGGAAKPIFDGISCSAPIKIEDFVNAMSVQYLKVILNKKTSNI